MIRLTLLLLILMLLGCDNVTVKERVLYEDRTPVKRGKVIQWNDNYKGTTYTDQDGRWSLAVPPDTLIELCIEEYERGIGKACYDGELITPALDSIDKTLKGQ